MTCSINIAVLAAVVFGFAWRVYGCDTEAHTEAGRVCGLRRWGEDGILYASFRGVPYAKQPVGELRFKELQPVDPWDGMYDATNEGPVCPQKDKLFGKLMQPQNMSEACIYANIHVPTDALPDPKIKSTKNKPGLPIFVFVHGGAFESGSGDADIYGPEYLVTKGSIVITFNYRLNVFGFLSLNSAGVPGNQGLRDMVTLLRWVQNNARAFGGDPGDVTLAGQSTGSICAHLLSLSSVTNNLFKRVVLMSGVAITSAYTPNPEYAQTVADLLLTNLGINSTDVDEIHDRLISLPLDTIMEAYYALRDQNGLVTFTPVVESSFDGVTQILDDYPKALIKKGRGNNIPLLLGFTNAECYSLQPRLKELKIVEAVNKNPISVLPQEFLYSLPYHKLKNVAKRVTQWFTTNGTWNWDQYFKYCSGSGFVYPAIRIAEKRAAAGAPTFLYQFSYAAEHSVVKKAFGLKYEGAGHFEDVTNIFRVNSALGDHRTFPPKKRDDRMKDWMTDFILNFMRCSHPSCDDKIGEYEVWPKVEKDLKYQDISKSKAYRHVTLDDELRDMVGFFRGILRRTSWRN